MHPVDCTWPTRSIHTPLGNKQPMEQPQSPQFSYSSTAQLICASFEHPKPMGKPWAPLLWSLSTHAPSIHLSKTVSANIPSKYLFTYNSDLDTTHSHSYSHFRNSSAPAWDQTKQTSHQSARADGNGHIHTSRTIRLGHCEVRASSAPRCTCSMSLWTISSHLQ